MHTFYFTYLAKQRLINFRNSETFVSIFPYHIFNKVKYISYLLLYLGRGYLTVSLRSIKLHLLQYLTKTVHIPLETGYSPPHFWSYVLRFRHFSFDLDFPLFRYLHCVYELSQHNIQVGTDHYIFRMNVKMRNTVLLHFSDDKAELFRDSLF